VILIVVRAYQAKTGISTVRLAEKLPAIRDYYLVGYTSCLVSLELLKLDYNQGVINFSEVNEALVDGVAKAVDRVKEKHPASKAIIEKIEAFFCRAA
jgi:hypothetical protein